MSTRYGGAEAELALPPLADEGACRPDPLDCGLEAVDQRPAKLGIAAWHHLTQGLKVGGGPEDPGRECRRATERWPLLDDGHLSAALGGPRGGRESGNTTAENEEVEPHGGLMSRGGG